MNSTNEHLKTDFMAKKYNEHNLWVTLWLFLPGMYLCAQEVDKVEARFKSDLSFDGCPDD